MVFCKKILRGDALAMKIKKIDIGEVKGFKLGNAENTEAGTGVTVIISEKGAVAGVDVRGGGPATRETDLLRSENTVDKVHATVLSGGSAFGLEAASGVMRSLRERGVGFCIDKDIIVPIVPAASLYDLPVGRSDVFPDIEMGREAVDNAYMGIFEHGNHGAGTGASAGKYMGYGRAMKTGLGTFACGDDLMQVGAIAAVNAVGDVYNGAGNIIAGLRSADGTEIKGTIRILKGMVHEGSDPDLNLSDIRTLAAAEAIKRYSESPAPVETPEEASDAVASEKDSILRAMMESYEQEQAQNAAESDNDSDGSGDAPEVPSEDTCPSENPSDEDNIVSGFAEDESSDVPVETETETEPETEIETEPEPVPEPQDNEQNADEQNTIDEYILTEEDMGYDVPFNTTISCLITNAILTKSQANKLASILHDAYARAIKPVHGTLDGDTVFVMSTCEQEVNFDAFAALATDVMQYAIIDAATSAEGAYGLPAARDIIHK